MIPEITIKISIGPEGAVVSNEPVAIAEATNRSSGSE
jgi:hypothetical protein